MNKLSRDINQLLKIWTLNIDGEVPVKFDNELSEFFFAQDLCRLLNKYYALGRKYEQRKRKIKQAKKRGFQNE